MPAFSFQLLFSQGHIAATCDMHLDLDGRQPTPVARPGRPQLLSPDAMEGDAYPPPSTAKASLQRSMELDTLAFDMHSVLQLEDPQSGVQDEAGQGSQQHVGFASLSSFLSYP
jgi:hypothetical protein